LPLKIKQINLSNKRNLCKILKNNTEYASLLCRRSSADDFTRLPDTCMFVRRGKKNIQNTRRSSKIELNNTFSYELLKKYEKCVSFYLYLRQIEPYYHVQCKSRCTTWPEKKPTNIRNTMYRRGNLQRNHAQTRQSLPFNRTLPASAENCKVHLQFTSLLHFAQRRPTINYILNIIVI
jgi:hypothetical protein